MEVLLTRRSPALRAHQGEVSFPGGRREPGEELVAAALREAQEETGLDPGAVEVLGELDHLMTVTSRSFIVPFVGLLPCRPTGLVPNPDEVAALRFAPVPELLADDVYREEVWTFAVPPPWVTPEDAELARSLAADGGGTERRIFFFELVGDTVWGATAAMLRQLLGLLLGIDVGIDHV
jgi:8-oxo-dGTP pyrophosphatase MutT (NUDIX family)